MEFIKKILCWIILISDKRPSLCEKWDYLFSIIITFAPIAYLLKGFDFWFASNHQFVTFVLICLVANIIVGAAYHKKMKTFDWLEFFLKNMLMWAVLIIVYLMLEILRLTAGNNIVGESFKVLIQITTLLYPISKVLKNAYILSNKQFPPAFIMKRLYSFEKSGNINDFFENEKTN